MSLQSTLLTTTAANVYASTGNTAITVMYIANYSTTANATFNLFAVTSGGSASNTNKIYSNVLVTAGDTFVIETERFLLDNNETIRANANANSD